MYQKSVLTLIVAINSKNVKRNGSWTEEEGQLITRMEALVAIKLVGTKFQVRVVATKELDRVDVAHHQSAEKGGEDNLFQLLDLGGGALRSRKNDFVRLWLVGIFVD